MEKPVNTVNISTVTVLKILLILLLVWFLWAVRDILILFIISVIISSAMDPLADFLQKRRIPRALSVLVVYALFIGLFVLVISLLVPPITEQFKQIAESNFIDNFNSRIGIYRQSISNLGFSDTIENGIKQFASNVSGTIFRTTAGVFTGLFSTVTILVISFYLSAEENGMKNFVKHLTPYRNQAYVMTLVNKIQRKMGAWVLGQIILSLVIFGLTYLGLTLMKVDYALVLALIAGILEIVPYIGPIAAAIPAIFFAFLQNPPLALAVLILYAVIQQLENHVIVPVVMSKSVGLNPVLVILGILVGGTLGGIIGAIVAVPIIGGLSVFVGDMMEENA